MTDERKDVGEVVVFDSSSLSHAFEDFVHAVVSGYAEAKSSRRGGDGSLVEAFKRAFGRRLVSESASRRFLLECDVKKCVVPESVYDEVCSKRKFRVPMRMFVEGGRNVESMMAGRVRFVHGFSRAFTHRIEVVSPPEEVVRRVAEVARRLAEERTIKGKVSGADVDGVALALHTNGLLVTADRNQCVLAKKAGAKVFYTMSEDGDCETDRVV